jgi:hypothetical protein
MRLNFQSPVRRFAAAAMFGALTACNDAPMTPRIIPGDGKPLSSLSAEELDARQDALLDALVADAPAPERARARTMLLRALESGSPLEAKPGKYASLATGLNAAAAEKHRRKAKPEAEPQLLRVSVGLVSSFKKKSTRSTVLRRPGDEGIPVLLLLESATPEDLTAGLSAARHSFQTVGRSPARAAKLESQAAPDLTPSAAAGKTLEWIKARVAQSSTSQKLPGYGTVRLVPVATPVQQP